MSNFVNTINVLGDDVLLGQLIDKSITTIRDNVVTIVGESAFNSCKSLTEADFPNASIIQYNAFAYCSSLKTLILRKASKCNLADYSSFSGAPIVKGTGYVYVPKSLLSSYTSDVYWKNSKAQFRALEDYTVDGTITGELDPTKI